MPPPCHAFEDKARERRKDRKAKLRNLKDRYNSGDENISY